MNDEPKPTGWRKWFARWLPAPQKQDERSRCVTIEHLARSADMHPDAVRASLERLEQRGFIRKVTD